LLQKNRRRQPSRPEVLVSIVGPDHDIAPGGMQHASGQST
jgi:hypothetical protein